MRFKLLIRNVHGIYDIMKGGTAAKEEIGIGCTLLLPAKEGKQLLRIDVRDNRVHVYRPLAYVRAVKC